MREEERGTEGEAGGNPVSNQTGPGVGGGWGRRAAEKKPEGVKWAWDPNCDQHQASQKTKTTPITPGHTSTHPTRASGGRRSGTPALAREDTMCSNYAIRENSKGSSQALCIVTFIRHFCKDLVPGCGWEGGKGLGTENGRG
jgi:hypothetical protein